MGGSVVLLLQELLPRLPEELLGALKGEGGFEFEDNAPYVEALYAGYGWLVGSEHTRAELSAEGLHGLAGELVDHGGLAVLEVEGDKACEGG